MREESNTTEKLSRMRFTEKRTLLTVILLVMRE